MSYEYRIKLDHETWQPISEEAVMELLEQTYGFESVVKRKLERMDEGHVISTHTMEFRRYDRSTAPLVSRPELQPDENGEYLWI